MISRRIQTGIKGNKAVYDDIDDSIYMYNIFNVYHRARSIQANNDFYINRNWKQQRSFIDRLELLFLLNCHKNNPIE